MVFKNCGILVNWTKVALASEGLQFIVVRQTWIISCHPEAVRRLYRTVEPENKRKRPSLTDTRPRVSTLSLPPLQPPQPPACRFHRPPIQVSKMSSQRHWYCYANSQINSSRKLINAMIIARLTLMQLVAIIWPFQNYAKNLKNGRNPGRWVLI